LARSSGHKSLNQNFDEVWSVGPLFDTAIDYGGHWGDTSIISFISSSPDNNNIYYEMGCWECKEEEEKKSKIKWHINGHDGSGEECECEKVNLKVGNIAMIMMQLNFNFETKRKEMLSLN
jgi:hypothetical protein